MILPFNTFSVFGLLGVMVTAPVAVVFYILYALVDRRLLDLLFANLMLCGAVGCICQFLQDNVVPAGGDARAISGAAVTTLQLFRIAFAMGLWTMATQLHFVFRYCRVDTWLSRRPWILYALAAASMPLVFSPVFLSALAEPRYGTSSWTHAVPWLPQYGPLVRAYTIVWALVQAVVLSSLIREVRKVGDAASGFMSHVGLILAAMAVSAVAVLVDLGQAALDVCSIGTFPFAAIAVGVLTTTALVKDKLAGVKREHRLARELEIAAQIQSALLPTCPPQVDGFDVAGWSCSAQETGGDTYDLAPVPGGRLLVGLADAAGHGMGAALLVSQTRALWRASLNAAHGPSRTLLQIDKLLSPDLVQEDSFVTCFIGLFDPTRSELTYASAGQGPIFFMTGINTQEGTQPRLIEEPATCPPLGKALLDAHRPRDRQFRFGEGDVVVVLSDGIYEAPGPSGDRFGIERVRQALFANRSLPADAIVARLREDLERFVGGEPQQDDMTIVVIRKT